MNSRTPYVRVRSPAVRIKLYTWHGVKEAFGVVYTDVKARDALISRLARSTGNNPKAVEYGDFPIEMVKQERLRRGWIQNAERSGAILALGLGAL